MFKGYLSLGGTEIANASRTEAYVKNAGGLIPLRNCIDCEDLGTVLGDGVYDSPLVDDAPWLDPTNNSTNDFYGLYPLEIEGIEDSTREAAVTESIVDGGSVGSVRKATRSVRVRGLLMAANEYAMSSGMTWLRNALDPSPCTTHGGSCGGAQLCYYAACPTYMECWEDTYAAGFSMGILNETPATSPFIIYDPLLGSSMWKASVSVNDANKEGLILRWGAVSETDTDLFVEQRGPAVMKRVNYVPYPNMKANSTRTFEFWDEASEGGLALRVAKPALVFMGGAPGPLIEYSWRGTPDDSISDAKLVPGGELAYSNLVTDPIWLNPGADIVIRRNRMKNPRPNVNWTIGGATNGTSTTEPDGGPVVAGEEIPWQKRTFAALPDLDYVQITPGATGINSNVILPNTEYTLSAYAISSAPMDLVELRVTWYLDNALLSADTTATSWTSVDEWGRFAKTLTSPPTANRVVVEIVVNGVQGVMPTGGYVGATAFLTEAAPTARQYFDSFMADPDVDSGIVYALDGTDSVLKGASIPQMPNVNNPNAAGVFSDYEAGVVVVPLTNGSNDTYMSFGDEATMQMGMVAGGQYTLMGYFYQLVEQTGVTHANARSAVVYADGVEIARSAVLPNLADEYQPVVLPFEVPLGATSVAVRLYNGSESDLAYWAGVGLIETAAAGVWPYVGPVFSGGDVDTRRSNRTQDMALPSAPVTISFDAAGDEDSFDSEMWVSLRSSADDSIIAEAHFVIPRLVHWDDPYVRYSFTAANGGPLSYLQVERGGAINVTNVLIEAGFTPLPYFDGGTDIDVAMAGYRDLSRPADEEYEIAWTGVTNESTSVVNYLGDLTIGAPPQGDEFTAYTGGLCHAYPRIDIAQGTLSGMLGVGLRLPISIEQQTEHLERTLHDVTCVSGPTIISERTTSNGSILREVDFVLVAGRPSPYGPTTDALIPTVMADLPTSQWIDTDCSEPEPVVIVDPDCPPVVAPPRPPSIPNACVTEETTWQRYWLRIEEQFVSSWSQTSPQVKITSGAEEIRQVRVRAFPNPFKRPVNTSSRRNLVMNPRAIATGTAWTSNPGTGGVAPLTYQTAVNFAGISGIPADITTGARLKWTTAPSSSTGIYIAATSQVGSVTPGRLYRMSAWGGFDRALAPVLGARVEIRFAFYDAGGSIIGASTNDVFVGVGVTEPWMVSGDVSLRAPANASYARISVGYSGTGSDSAQPQIGDELWMTGAFVQEVPQDDEIVLVRNPNGQVADPVYRIDFDNLPGDAVLTNATVTTDINNNRIMMFTPSLGVNAELEFTTPPVLLAGHAYALVLDGVYSGDGFASVATIQINNTISDAYDPGDPFRDVAGGTVVMLSTGDNEYNVIVSSTIAEEISVYGVAVYEIEYSQTYFDGSSPDASGDYYNWLGAPNASESVAASGVPVDPCSYCSEFIVSYLPPRTTLTVDSILERAFASVAGGEEASANHLLYSGDGGPMTWPELTCGMEYLIAIDVPEPLLNDVTVSVTLTQKE